MKNFFALLLLLSLVGCVGPLKPGVSTSTLSNGTVLNVKQSENPQQATKQVYHHNEERTIENGSPVTKSEEVVETTIGAAQKDVSREIGAKLSSLRGIVWVGVLLFLFGIASAVYPPLKLVVGGSMTTSAAIVAAGLALIVLPTLIVGHELLILGVAVGAAALWYLAHRHGSLRGELNAIKEHVVGKK